MSLNDRTGVLLLFFGYVSVVCYALRCLLEPKDYFFCMCHSTCMN